MGLANCLNRSITVQEGQQLRNAMADKQYDALVLYAEEDQTFVDDMRQRLTNDGFHICTKDDLEAGYATEYVPMTDRISRQCLRIILVFSPEFLNSADMTFYMEFAQADSLGNKQHKIIPIMYRNCRLPNNMMYYLPLYYEAHGRMYNFWVQLRETLEHARSLS